MDKERVIPGVLKDIEKKHRAFSTGSQFSEWSYRNCLTCKFGFNDKHSKFGCERERALVEAYCGDGQITEQVAKAIGFLDNKECYVWECPGWARG